MKVVHIDSEKYFGGGQNQVYLLNKYLLKKGVKSVVFCPQNSPLFLKLKEKYDVYPLSILNLVRYIKGEKPDILHVHSGRALTFSHILKILNPKISVVFTRRIAKGIKFCLLRKFLINGVVCISEEVKKNLVKCFPENRIFIVYSGMEKDEIFVPQPSWYKKDKFIIGNIGHLLPYKDHITLIRGFYEFLKIYPEAVLVIIGEGKERKKIEKLITELKIESKVFLTGFLPDAGAYIKYFSVFVITSAHTEGLCSSVIDSFMKKVPVIATDAGGIKELVKNNETGILIKIKDPESLKKALIKIKEDKEFVKYITQKAYQYSFQFTAEKMAERNLGVYKTILNI